MILQALNRYYDILSTDPQINIAPPGYCTANVSFAINLSSEGELLDIFPLFVPVERGNKLEEKPRRMIVPEQVKRSSGISPNFLCDNNSYVLGISEKESKDANYAIKRFESFRQYNVNLLEKADCDTARCVIYFLKSYLPSKGEKHPSIRANFETLVKGGNLVFCVENNFVHEDAVIREAWETHRAGSQATRSQCLVTGQIAPIARLHPSLKGIRDANPTGASLVGFNARAYESYNRVNGQGMNSPVSETAVFAYTTILNYLLSAANPNKKIMIGDTTVVYWAESEKKEYAAAFAGIFSPEVIYENTGDNTGQKKTDELIREIAQRVRRTQALDIEGLRQGLDDKTRFYVLGLAPNAARVSVRFFLTDPFGKMIDRIMQHYRDLAIVKEYDRQPTYITVKNILDETVSKKISKPQPSPLMAGAVMRAILTNSPYPAALYYAIMTRIRADTDDEKGRKINYTRAAVIKTFLIRKYRNQSIFKEVLVMSLNEQSTIPAYVLGRLFAVLEKVQFEAVGDINASIKDRYFTAACASPASVFPILLRLSQHHISKAEFGRASDRRIQDILNLLDVELNPIPQRLSLDEQGVFVLGYYHQRAAFYEPKNEKTGIEEISTEAN